MSKWFPCFIWDRITERAHRIKQIFKTCQLLCFLAKHSPKSPPKPLAMGAKPKFKEEPTCPALVEAVEEIMKLYKSLPPRPSIEEVEAALSVLETVANEEQAKLEEISKLEKPKDVPQEIFDVLQKSKKTMVLFQNHEQRKEASYVVETDKLFHTFDDLIQRASGLVSGDVPSQNHVDFSDPVEKVGREAVIRDQSLVKKKKMGYEEDEKDGFKGLVRSASTLSSGQPLNFFNFISEFFGDQKIKSIRN